MRKTADAVVLVKKKDKYKILLIKRKNAPFQGEYALPGGFLEEGEDPLEGCLRELYEETDLALQEEDSIALSLRKKKGRDPRGETHTYPFLFVLKEEKKIKAKDDALAASWVSLKQVDHLAFDHGAILCEALGKFSSIMPGSLSVIEKLNEDVIFFGGTFNPWHEGHEICVKQFLDEVKDKKLVVVPDTSPWKIGSQTAKYHCYYQRYKEIKEKLNRYPVEIYPGFLGKETANPTVDWFGTIRARNKGLLMGDDQFQKLGEWTKADELIKEMDFLFVVPRILKDNERKDIFDKLKMINKKLAILFLSDHAYKHVSSSTLRGDYGEG